MTPTDDGSRAMMTTATTTALQFDLPMNAKEFEAYTHRIGRTGRAGKAGVATALYVPGDEPKVKF